jgi:flagellar basal-body rod modification protein FlgD
MAIDPTTGTTTAATTATTASSSKKADQVLGKDDFLKLMVAQMKNQDPMNPSDDKDNIAQMAQFSSLEQITNLATATQDLANKMSLTQNIGLLGHTVTYTGANGTAVSGTVDGMNLEKDGTATLSVAGQTGVDPTSITAVR